MAGHDHHGPVHPPDGLLRDPFQKPRPIEQEMSQANQITLMDDMTDVIKDGSRWKLQNSMLELLVMMMIWLSEFTIFIALSQSYR
ncbi:MAG: hypothetical protein V2A77_08490 [Pseudomonadota bacterium]